MRVPMMHLWRPQEVYQAYVSELLRNNPGVVQRAPARRKTKKGTPGARTTHRRVVGGYWGKHNPSHNMSNFWIYTMVKNKQGIEEIVEVINYDRWVAIINTYFIEAKKHIIMGEELALGGCLGAISARLIERSHSRRKINFHETKKQPMVWTEDDRLVRKKIVYFDDDNYIRIGWRRGKRIKNERVYEFTPAGPNANGNGFKEEFSRANIQNPALKLRYSFYPLIPVTN